MPDGIGSTGFKGRPSIKRAAAALSFSLLGPCAAHPARIWQAAQGTITDVTTRAARCYDTIRFVYCFQQQSEHRKTAE